MSTDGQLRDSYLPWPQVVGQGIGLMAPATLVATATVLVIDVAGNGAWFALVLALVLMLLVAVNVVELARRFPSVGSLYSWTRDSLGLFASMVVGAAQFVAYIAAAVVFTGFAASYIFATFDNNNPAVLPLVVAGAAILILAGAFAWRDVKLSTLAVLILEVVSLTIIVVIAVVVLVKSGLPDPLQNPAHWDANAIRLGLILATVTISGWESATVLGREAKNPHQAIPRVVLGVVLGVALWTIVMTYIELGGFHAAHKNIATSAVPLADLASYYGVPALGKAISVGIVISASGCCVASINAAARIIFAMGDDGRLHRSVSRVHPSHKTPHVAVATATCICVIAYGLPLALGAGLLGVLIQGSVIAALGFLTMYTIVSIAAPILLQRVRQAAPWRWIMSAVAVAALLYVFEGQFNTSDAWTTSNVVGYLFLGFVLLVGASEAIRPRPSAPPMDLEATTAGG